MENLLLLLPARPQSLAIRYAVTTLIVLVCFLLQIGVEMQSGFFGFFLLLPSIFLASVLFDRGSGFYATLLCTILSIFVLSPPGPVVLPAQHLLPVLLFVLIGLAVATVSEALRKALEHAVAAERAKDLLMHELNHRIRNNLAMVASVLELQMRAQREPLAKQALATAVARIHVIANAHDHLMPRDGHSAIDMNEYLTKCCRHLGDALRDVRPIAINVSAAQIYLRSDKAVAIGLIVNELVTNAFKYAFPDDRSGVVSVTLHRGRPGEMELKVEDNGKGCPEDAPKGLGSRIVQLLAEQLTGILKREDAHPGCRVLLTIPER